MLSAVLRIFRLAFGTTDSASSLIGSGKFDDVGHKQMTRHEGVEDEAEENVVATVIVTANADKNAVLISVLAHCIEKTVTSSKTF